MEIIIGLLWPLLFMPTITGYMATSHGRSFWRWFGIGCVLPYFSLPLISYVVYRDQRRARPNKSDTSHPHLPSTPPFALPAIRTPVCCWP